MTAPVRRDNSAHIQRIREEVPAVLSTVYLNTGTCGPLPRRAIAAMHQAADDELMHGRIARNHYEQIIAASTEVKADVAKIIGCDRAELALCRHTTDGMNLAIAGFPWREGDEIVTSNLEHPSGLLPIYLAKRRYGVQMRIADIGVGDASTDDIVAAFERQMSPRTRMLVLSHIPYTTGTVLPVKELVAMAHSHNVVVVIDGAQSYGQIPLDMHDLGVDFYACPGQKWMCGPEETGVFFARAGSLDYLEQTIVGPFGARMDSLDYLAGTFEPAEDASRFDVGSISLPLLRGQQAATTWIRDDVGLDWAADRIAALGRFARELLLSLDGVEVVTPADRSAGLLSFVVNGIDPEDLSSRLADDYNIAIRYVTRYISNPRANRLAAGFYTTEEDLMRLGEAIQAIRRTA